MRILIATRLFAPSIGGIETVLQLLAREFSSLGHSVRVYTTTSGGAINAPFEVVRDRSIRTYVQQLQWSDVVLQPNISLKLFLPARALGKPVLVTHQQWYYEHPTRKGLRGALKQWLCRRASNICCSQAMASHLRRPSSVIHNPYDTSQYFLEESIVRTDSVVFVGRLVSDKGADVLLHALHILGDEAPRCTIVGDGPERSTLEQLVGKLQLSTRVQFLGPLQGAALRKELHRHEVIVIPSRFNEPFGIVALEGMACGCVPIGTEGGGLPEAIGRCGGTVPNGDAAALAESVKTLLRDSSLRQTLRESFPAHLRKHDPRLVARRYLECMEELCIQAR